ncbi:MAG TPA: MFS transporter [Nitrospirota bacterium]|nr:MFS transporter [Nitrospirota bacterium]
MSSALQHRPFALFLYARVSTAIAFQLLGVAVGWQVYSLTNSALYLGLVGLAQFLPLFLLTLVVGHVADRYDRRVVASICQIVEGLAAGALAWGSISGWMHEGSILTLVFVIGAARAFEGPTMQVLVPTLVPSELISKAVAWAASAMQTATILGPALGGFLYMANPVTVYAASSSLFILASIFIALIRIKPIPAKREPIRLKSLFAGIIYIRSHPVILGAISLDLFAVLLGGATALLPIYARDILMTGAWGLGLLRSAPALGALLVSVLLAEHPLRRHVGRTMFIAVAIFGISTIMFAVSTSFLLSLGILTILGAADVISIVIRQSLVQISTPDDMRGRVSAVNSMFIGTSNQLGEFESGVTAAWFGVIPAVLIGGIGTIVIVILWVRLFPQLMRVDSLELINQTSN